MKRVEALKRFADLHLNPDLGDRQGTERLLCKLSTLGYRLVGISLPVRAKQEDVDFLKKACRNCHLDFASRIDLSPRSSGELLQLLRRFRRRFELTSVGCLSKSIARQAAKDHRVDLLAFPSSNPHRRFFDVAQARLASQGLAALEIDMGLLLRTAGPERVRLFAALRRETTIAKKFNVPVVLSSNAASPHELRGPRDFAALATLFGMNTALALKALSATPSVIVDRNRSKLDENYVAKGIRITQRPGK